MAMSYSRPDPSSPAEIADAAFSTGRRGFDQGEVREFLRMVAAELGRLQERERFLERELRTAQASPDLDSARLDDDALARLLGEETARVITAARESAAEIRAKAEEAAAQMLSEASDESSRLREEAEIEASRRRADAATDAEAEVSMAKQQGREMVNEARAYRERVLSELARRRELAREQIEQLIHGRDRLMQAFERARLVAVDVVAEMQPLGEPDEYVNLAPTTGPVPVMVARETRDASSIAVGETDAASGDEADRADDTDTRVDSPEAGAVEDGGDDTEEGAAVESGNDLGVSTAESDRETGDGAGDDGETIVEPDASDLRIRDDAETVADAAIDSTTTSPTDADAADDEVGEGSDVVVDLFARLRADAAVAATGEADDAPPDDRASLDEDRSAAGDAGATSADDSGPTAEGSHEDSPFGRRDADLTPLIVASAKKLKRVLADEQNEVLDALRRNDPVRNLDALLPWASEHAARYTSAIADDLLVAAQAGAGLVSDGARVVKLRKAASRDAVDHANRILEESLISPLRERLERCVADGAGDNAAITKKVRATYRECKTQHIDEQLDDVLRAAHGRGVLAALDPGRPVVWVVDPRHDGCPDCEDNALAGAVAAGQAFPTGHTFAPAHPGCRCLLTPMPLDDD